LWDAILILVQNLILVTPVSIVACLLKARIVKLAEKQTLLGNGCVTHNNGVTVRRRVSCGLLVELPLSPETAVSGVRWSSVCEVVSPGAEER
jgi:hypothetical protein